MSHYLIWFDGAASAGVPPVMCPHLLTANAWAAAPRAQLFLSSHGVPTSHARVTFACLLPPTAGDGGDCAEAWAQHHQAIRSVSDQRTSDKLTTSEGFRDSLLTYKANLSGDCGTQHLLCST